MMPGSSENFQTTKVSQKGSMKYSDGRLCVALIIMVNPLVFLFFSTPWFFNLQALFDHLPCICCGFILLSNAALPVSLVSFLMMHVTELASAFPLAVAVMGNTGLSSSVQSEIAPGSSSTKPVLDRYSHGLLFYSLSWGFRWSNLVFWRLCSWI